MDEKKSRKEKCAGFELGMKVFVVERDEIPRLLSRIVKDLECQCSENTMAMAVSGGSLPSLLGKELISDFNWRVFLADERIVDQDSEDSNFKLIMETVLSKWKNSIGYPINYKNLADPDQIAIDYESKLDQIIGNNPFDIIFLGMGPDGNILFIMRKDIHVHYSLDTNY